MKNKISATAQVLKWARESASLSLDDVAKKLKKDRQFILDVENGEKQLTYSQLSMLAYTLYNRPLAVFFLPEPPEDFQPESEFRSLPFTDMSFLDRDTRLIMRKAKSFQVSLYELFEHLPSKPPRIYDVENHKKSIVNFVNHLRLILGITLKHQKQFRSIESAFKTWRSSIENTGVFVFKESFKNDNICGFALYDDLFPALVINNKNIKTRQIFTLFHELIHIILKHSDICFDSTDYNQSQITSIEHKCNVITSEFLVPNDDLMKRIVIPIDDDLISKLSDLYSVSREVILRRLLDKRKISKELYDQKTHEWKEQMLDRPKSDSGNPINTKISYLGDKYLRIVVSNYQKGLIETEQLYNFLNTKTTPTALNVVDSYIRRRSAK
jgi:Zn-dependent peptidase ImmA (M78 family)